MAGGKETPRQKMIGMMYLVLTALLALNVSVTVLDKFAFINESLERANEETSTRNASTIVRMAKSAKDKGDTPKDLAVVADAEALRERTSEVVARLEEFKEDFVNETGGYLPGYKEAKNKMHIQGKTDYDRVGNYMMPKEEGGDGKGAEMKEILKEYAKDVRSFLQKNNATEDQLALFEDLALDADDHPYWKTDPNQRGKKWSQVNFEQSPTHAALATVSEFQANVLSYETAGLDFLASRVGLGALTFETIRPVIMPESKYVAAGTNYKADMFIAASPPKKLMNQTVMKYNGNIAEVVDGVGKVEFKASASKYDKNGNARREIIAEIKLPSGGGNDTTFIDTIEYFVVKPVLQFQSASVSTLYYNCGNNMIVECQALGNQYNPTFSVKGGDAIKGSQRGEVTIVPKQRKVVLNVSNNGTSIGTQEFGVRTIPAPEIKVYTANGKEVNIKDGISVNTPELYIKAIPDESFKQFLPDDAKFRIAECEVTLVTGGLARGSARFGEKINLRNMKGRKGGQIAIEIKTVQRQNFRNQVEDFQKHTRFINIPLK